MPRYRGNGGRSLTRAALNAFCHIDEAALLPGAPPPTMVPAISQFLSRDTKASAQIEAIAAACRSPLRCSCW